MNTKRRIKKKDLKKMMTIVIVFLILVSAFFIVLNYFENKDIDDTTNEVNNDILDSKEKLVDDISYVHKRKIHTYLFIGVDKTGEAIEVGSNIGAGQGDVQMLITFDDTKRTWQILQLNRDAMVDMNVIGGTGDIVGTVFQQLCLAHSYGDGMEMSCENNVDTVSRMLEDENIDGYFALNMDGIQVLNNALGGITVNNESDFSDVDSSMKMGTITLTDSQAEEFVRGRLNVDDQTNGARMKRQLEFINGLFAAFENRDADFALSVYNKLSSYVVTNISENDMTKIYNKMQAYTEKALVTITGDLKSEDGHWAFYQSQRSTNEAIVEMFYDIKGE